MGTLKQIICMSTELRAWEAQAKQEVFLHNRAGHYGYKTARPEGTSKHSKSKRK